MCQIENEKSPSVPLLTLHSYRSSSIRSFVCVINSDVDLSILLLDQTLALGGSAVDVADETIGWISSLCISLITNNKSLIHSFTYGVVVKQIEEIVVVVVSGQVCVGKGTCISSRSCCHLGKKPSLLGGNIGCIRLRDGSEVVSRLEGRNSAEPVHWDCTRRSRGSEDEEGKLHYEGSNGEDRVDTAEGAKEGRTPKWLVMKRMYF